MQVELVSLTQPLSNHPAKSPEDLIVYTARVSSPQNQENLATGAGLLKYCLRKGHWSVFDMVDMTLEVKTSRAISAQILRHWSFDFQEFSQRYAQIQGFETYNARRQDSKNRQNSIDDLPPETQQWFWNIQKQIQRLALSAYEEALELGIAKESARFLLPMETNTTFYMKGSVRSWLTYFMVRLGEETQKEHRDVALLAWKIFEGQFPVVAEAFKLVRANGYAFNDS